MKKYLPLFFLLLCLQAWGQNAPRSYWVQFTDKKYSPYSLNSPLAFLSQKSIDRRTKQGLELNETDLPVSPVYLDSLRQMGVKILYTSRWLNAATIHTQDSLFPEKVSRFSFVSSTRRVMKRKKGDGVHMEPSLSVIMQDNFTSDEYGQSFQQIDIHRGEMLHDLGFTGKGIQIAQLDAGFWHVDSMKAFDALRSRHGILKIHDFVKGNDSGYREDAHGMEVLSVMAGYLPGKLIGTSPDADFYLLRTENAPSEYLIEEANWIAAIEWADSAGADIIHSSLGYSEFDDSSMNHTYADLNGHTTYISKEASMAAGKGLIVVSSAGNSGNQPWHFITAPADATDILTVGALDEKLKVAGFSSRGPTADGRVKPDICAIGGPAYVASVINGEVMKAWGTSSAAPVISGLVACLWQAFPDKTALEIMDAVRRSSNKYRDPDANYGYGIPDFMLARDILMFGASQHENRLLGVFPNPFQHDFFVEYYTRNAASVELTLCDAMGRLVLSRTISVPADNFNKLEITTELPKGFYILTLNSAGERTIAKLIRE